MCRYDRTICMYDSERPENAITRYEKCHEGAICSLTIDTDSNWLVTGSYDGSVKLWSQEGRCLDQVLHVTLLPLHSSPEGMRQGRNPRRNS
jgi:WD40 repeat protein